MPNPTLAVTFVCLTLAMAPQATLAQEANNAGLALCDPLLDPNLDYREGEEEDLLQKTVRYDLETAVPLASDAEVIDILAEERWDPATGAVIARTEACPKEPTFIIHWARAMGVDQAGKPAPLATGYLSLRRDGSFGFTYEKRPYDGTWTLSDAQVTLAASWLNGGQPLVTPVDRVTTPVEYRDADGSVATYDEVTYRLGPFRLTPIDTTVKGTDQTCRCDSE